MEEALLLGETICFLKIGEYLCPHDIHLQARDMIFALWAE